MPLPTMLKCGTCAPICPRIPVNIVYGREKQKERKKRNDRLFFILLQINLNLKEGFRSLNPFFSFAKRSVTKADFIPVSLCVCVHIGETERE
jgi:hypothetical protein